MADGQALGSLLCVHSTLSKVSVALLAVDVRVYCPTLCGSDCVVFFHGFGISLCARVSLVLHPHHPSPIQHSQNSFSATK